MKSKFRWGIPAVVMVGALLAALGRHRSPVNPVLEKAKAETRAEMASTLETIKPKKAGLASAQEGISPQTRQRVAAAYGFLAKVRYSVERDSAREPVLSALASDPEAVAAASRYVRDLALVKEHFGAKQGEARLFSIAVLAARAKQGDAEPLREATGNLAESLARGSRNAGQLRDLEDLVIAYVASDKKGAFTNLDNVLKTLQYKPELRQQYLAGVYFALQTEYSKEEIEARLKQAGISLDKENPS